MGVLCVTGVKCSPLFGVVFSSQVKKGSRGCFNQGFQQELFRPDSFKWGFPYGSAKGPTFSGHSIGSEQHQRHLSEPCQSLGHLSDAGLTEHAQVQRPRLGLTILDPEPLSSVPHAKLRRPSLGRPDREGIASSANPAEGETLSDCLHGICDTKPRGLSRATALSTSRSSSREVRISWYQLSSVVYFSRGNLPKKKKKALLEDLWPMRQPLGPPPAEPPNPRTPEPPKLRSPRTSAGTSPAQELCSLGRRSVLGVQVSWPYCGQKSKTSRQKRAKTACPPFRRFHESSRIQPL